MADPARASLGRAAAVSAGVLIATALVLRAMGHTVWCACGASSPWSWDIWSRHNSQHLLDPYTFTHVLHGLAYYFFLWAVAGRFVSPLWRGVLALTIESAWEILENSPVVIERYRESTISLDYFGDSVLNSLSDVGASVLGFWLAWKLPWKASLALFVATELVLLWWVHDSLLLNILQLLYPLESVKQWQMSLGG